MIAQAKPLTVAEKCAACGVTEKTLRNWWALGCPKEADVEDTLAWRDARFGKKEAKAESGEDLRERKLLAEAIKIEAEGRIKELDARVKEGELVPRDAVERWLMSFATELRQTIQSWPAIVVSEVPGDVRLVVDDVLTEQVRLLLTRLSGMSDELWGDETVKDSE